MKKYSRKLIAEKKQLSYENLNKLKKFLLTTPLLLMCYCEGKEIDPSPSIQPEVITPEIVISDHLYATEDITENNQYLHDAFIFFKWERPAVGWNLVNYSWTLDNVNYIEISNKNSVSWIDLKNSGYTLVNGRSYVFKVKATYPNGEERIGQISFKVNTEAPLIIIKESESGSELTTSLENASTQNLFNYTRNCQTPYISWSLLHPEDKENITGYTYFINGITPTEVDAGLTSGIQITTPLELNKTYIITVYARYRNGTISPKTQVFYRPVEDHDIGTIYIGPKNEYYTTMLRTPTGGYCYIGYESQVVSSTDKFGNTINKNVNNILVSVYDQNMQPLFHQSLGGSDNEDIINKVSGYEQAIITTDNCLLLTTQTFSNDGNAVGNHGSADILIIKLDLENSNVLWQKTVGTAGYERQPLIIESPDGTYKIFYLSSETIETPRSTFIEALGTSGNTLWKKTYTHSYAKAIALNNGNFSLIENTVSETDEQLLKVRIYSANGEETNSTSIEKMTATEVTKTIDNKLIITGYSINSGDNNIESLDARAILLDSDLSILHNFNYGGSARDFFSQAHQLTSGGFIFTGETMSNDRDVAGNHGSSDIWIVETTANGNIVNQKCIGSTSLDRHMRSLLLADDSLVLLYINSSTGKTIVRMKNNNILWTKNIPIINSSINNLTADSDGNIRVMGSIPGSKGMNAWTFKINKETGEFL